MKISDIIQEWYKNFKRDLPWRKTKDPYGIWISEIILQQTRVKQGMSYYIRFLQKYPDVISLAEADEQNIIKLWQGLGYYTRARNLHKAALQIVTEYDGIFPRQYGELLKLKGVGPYTAAAIASIAFDEPLAVVDGNVERVISRLFAIADPVNSAKGKNMIKSLADNLMDDSQPGLYNQAIMEFGALQCVPLNPDCSICPLNEQCEAFLANHVLNYPNKLKTQVLRKRYFTYIIFDFEGTTFLRQRKENDIWERLYEFPMLESTANLELDEIAGHLKTIEGLNNNFRVSAVSGPVKHQLTHQTIYARFVHVQVLTEGFKGLPDWKKVILKEMDAYPIPRLIDRYLESNG